MGTLLLLLLLLLLLAHPAADKISMPANKTAQILWNPYKVFIKPLSHSLIQVLRSMDGNTVAVFTCQGIVYIGKQGWRCIWGQGARAAVALLRNQLLLGRVTRYLPYQVMLVFGTSDGSSRALDDRAVERGNCMISRSCDGEPRGELVDNSTTSLKRP